MIDGQILEKPPMGAYENYINNFLAKLLIIHVEANRLGMVHVECLFHLGTQRNLKRRPTLAFVSAARWPIDKRVPKAEAWHLVPDLAVAVISDSNRSGEIVRKIDDYFEAGVLDVWVVYPDVRKVYVYSSPSIVRIVSGNDGLVTGEVVAGFQVTIDAIFGEDVRD